MLRKLLATSSTWITVPLRLATAAVFIGHGAQKVLGSWGGPGLSKMVANPAPFPFMRPSWLWMGAAAFAEFFGGIMLLLGLFTRVGAFLIACTMLVAVVGVHWGKFFLAAGGFEYAMTLFAVALALLISGGGALSLDRALAGQRK